jgi:nitrogen fixation/metabolism regulation signal transduction histidine kinase
MAAISYYQNSRIVRNNRISVLQRIDSRISETFKYISENYADGESEEIYQSVFQQRVFEISNIYKVNINIYNLQGKLLVSNRQHKGLLKKEILNTLKNETKYIQENVSDDKKNAVFNVFSYIVKNGKPIGILNTQTVFSSSASAYQQMFFLKQYLFVVIFLAILSGFAAWFISKRLTRKIENISETLEKTNVAFLDHPLEYSREDEVKPLVDAYNNMLGKLKKQTYLLQKNEREEAWKEMAKQVAHEINNPLTPLRLSIQNFQRKYKQDDPENDKKIKALTETLVHQIDIISSITKSFSDFAKMPVNQDSEIDVVETIRRTVDIFPQTVVYFSTNTAQLFYKMDSLYLTRIITNIVKNGIQASSDNRNKKIIVTLTDAVEKFMISISDNGNGIREEYRDRIFEPNFTTKSTGMGLGLSMVKKIVEDYEGKIWFATEENVGTTFYVEFNKLD